LSGEELAWILVALGLASLLGIAAIDRYEMRLEREDRREYLNQDTWGT
jgi:hypothetical protein